MSDDVKDTSGSSEPQSMADLFYGGDAGIRSEYAPALAESVGRLTDITGLDPAAREAYLMDAAHNFRDAGIRANTAAGLHELIVDHVKAPADEETVTRWTEESRRALRERYGDGAAARLAKVQAFVDARPGLKQMLTETGVGNHPRIVMQLADNAHTLRVTPRPRRAT